MGAKLSIENDLPTPCYIEVWTVGGGFLVTQGTVKPYSTTDFDLELVWYDVKFSLESNWVQWKRFFSPPISR